MGPGGSQDAPFDLRASVPAGSYHVQCDNVIIAPVDVTFTLILRSGSGDTTLAEHVEHFEKNPDGSLDATAYGIDMAAPAIDFDDGDQLVFRYAGANTTSQQAFIPDGDNAIAIPTITLPQ